MTSDLDLISFNTEFNHVVKKQSIYGDANNNSSTESKDESTDNENNNDVVKKLTSPEEDLLVQVNGEDVNSVHINLNGTDSIHNASNENSLLFGSINNHTNCDSEKPSDSLQCLSFIQENSFSKVEETEVLETDNITESVEFMISPSKCSSELISIVSEESFESDFTLVADVKVENGDLTEEEIRDSLENKCGLICVENELPLSPKDTKRMSEDDLRKPLVAEQRKENTDKVLNLDLKTHSLNKKLVQTQNESPVALYPAAKIIIPRNEKPEKVPTAESKIAMEIREMREREEELRKMREAALKKLNENGISEKNALHVNANTSEKSPSTQLAAPVKLIKATTPIEVSKGPSVNGKSNSRHPDVVVVGNSDPLNLGQDYNVGCVFAPRRKGVIKVKPMLDEETKCSNFKVLQESPVEREIRIAKEKEEELKKERERALLIKEQLEGKCDRSNHVDKGVSNINDKCEDNNINEVPKPALDTVKKLATSRIQQEIEEQTQREKALKLAGSIKTLSVERTDEKVNILCNTLCINTSSNLSHLESSNWDAEISPGSSTKSSSSGIFFSHRSDPDDSLLLYSDNSNNSVTRSNEPSSIRRFSNSPTSKNISMQRFIASKGKEIVFGNGVTKNNAVGCFDYHEIKPPQMRKGENILKKRSVTAELKIQEELREMEAREAELRNQRNRYLGMSQPNLCALDDQDDLLESNGTDQLPLERCSSNPNLLDDDSNSEGMSEQNFPVGGPRRRSILIDQWEQRIQKADLQT